MDPTADTAGRVVAPKETREAVGRTARLVEVDGALVADADTVVTDDDVLGLVDTERR